jgi:non-heme chloroperoxidase
MAPGPTCTTAGEAETWSDPATHKSGFVIANGARLNVLDWEGPGPALILVHGGVGNGHWFDDLAPALTDRFRVVAFSRRANGRSEPKPPYDNATLTEDLLGLMDALGIARAHLAGYSMGGNIITRMAGVHPERVDRLVYLDGAYDLGDPELIAALTGSPSWSAATPPNATASMPSYLKWSMSTSFPAVKDGRRVEAYLRDLVDVRPDGTVRFRLSGDLFRKVIAAVTPPAERRDYTKVRSPALAIYGPSYQELDHGSAEEMAARLSWERDHLAPVSVAHLERLRRSLPSVELVKVSGTHSDFLFTARDQVVAAVRRFLLAR